MSPSVPAALQELIIVEELPFLEVVVPLGLSTCFCDCDVDGLLGDGGGPIVPPKNLLAGIESGSGPLVDPCCSSVVDFAEGAVGSSLTGGALGGGPEGCFPFCPMAKGSVLAATGGGGMVAVCAREGSGPDFTICCGFGFAGCSGCKLPSNALVEDGCWAWLCGALVGCTCCGWLSDALVDCSC